MKQLLPPLLAALRRGESAVLCSVLASRGSTPRGAGAHMAVFADGSSLGTVGGGAVEYECQKLAQKALAEGRGGLCRFSLTQAETGMVCGGDVSLCLKLLGEGDLPLLEAMDAAAEEAADAWLVLDSSDERAVKLALYRPCQPLVGAEIPEAALQPLLRRCAAAEGPLYAEPFVRARTVYVFGGGHVSQALAPLLAALELRFCLYEDRAEFSTAELFPQAHRRITASFEDIFAHIDPRPGDYAVVLTRGHECDYAVLRQLLQRKLSYLGVIGSRKKTAAVNEKLRQSGIPQEAIGRILSPIGLDIGAQTPAEIAVSIAAELIAHRAREDGA